MTKVDDVFAAAASAERHQPTEGDDLEEKQTYAGKPNAGSKLVFDFAAKEREDMAFKERNKIKFDIVSTKKNKALAKRRGLVDK